MDAYFTVNSYSTDGLFASLENGSSFLLFERLSLTFCLMQLPTRFNCFLINLFEFLVAQALS